MNEIDWTRVIVVVTWIVVPLVAALFLMRVPREFWIRYRWTLLLAVFVLLVPFVVLAARYAPVSCGSLSAEHACVCYALRAHVSDSDSERQRLFARADDICPGHARYRTGAGR